MKLDFQDLKKKLRARAALAVTLESGRLAVTLVHREENETQLAPSLSIPFGAADVLKNPEKVGQALDAALSAAGIRERRCVACVPPGWALTASTDLPEVGAEDLRGYLELRAEKEFSIPATDLRLGYCAYALPNGLRRATLAALPAKKIEAVEQMLDAARGRVLSISLALDRCLAQPQAMLHFLTNGNHTDVVITAGGGVAGLRSLAGPQSSGDTTFDPATFCREVRITLGRLPETVRQQVRRAEFGGPSAQKLCLATRYDLLRMGIESPECRYGPGVDAAAPDAPGAAVESARLQLREEPIPFELVVPEIKRWETLLQRFDTKRRRWLVLAGIGLVLLPLLLFFIRAQMESHYQTQWNGMAKNVAELDALQQKIHQFRPWFEPAPQGLQVMESLVAAFPEQGEVWAKSIQVEQIDKTAKNAPGNEDYKITCSAFALNESVRLAFIERLRARPGVVGLQVQQLRGDKPVQFAFTYKWESRHEK